MWCKKKTSFWSWNAQGNCNNCIMCLKKSQPPKYVEQKIAFSSSCCIQENQGETYRVGQCHDDSSWHSLAPRAAAASRLIYARLPYLEWILNEYCPRSPKYHKLCHFIMGELSSLVITNVQKKKKENTQKNYNAKTIQVKIPIKFEF